MLTIAGSLTCLHIAARQMHPTMAWQVDPLAEKGCVCVMIPPRVGRESLTCPPQRCVRYTPGRLAVVLSRGRKELLALVQIRLCVAYSQLFLVLYLDFYTGTVVSLRILPGSVIMEMRRQCCSICRFLEGVSSL